MVQNKRSVTCNPRNELQKYACLFFDHAYQNACKVQSNLNFLSFFFNPFFSAFFFSGMRIFYIATFAIAFNSVACHVIGLEKRQQDDAIATPGISELRLLPWGKVNFIHTTDTHGKLYCYPKLCILTLVNTGWLEVAIYI